MGRLSEGYTTNLPGLFGELSAGSARPLPIAPMHLYAACLQPSGGTELSLRNPSACSELGAGCLWRSSGLEMLKSLQESRYLGLIPGSHCFYCISLAELWKLLYNAAIK